MVRKAIEIDERGRIERPFGIGGHRQPFGAPHHGAGLVEGRSEEHTSELQSLMRISYAVFCLKKKKNTKQNITRACNTGSEWMNSINKYTILIEERLCAREAER